MSVLDELKRAFRERSEPAKLWSPEHVPEDVKEVESFSGLDWSDMTTVHLDQNHSAIYFFSPEAFAYFLPRILAAGVAEDRADLLAFDAIVGSLDRSPRADYWDDGFRHQWMRLSSEECRAVQLWLLWMQEREAANHDENAFDRAFDTLTLLAEHADADSSAPRLSPDAGP